MEGERGKAVNVQFRFQAGGCDCLVTVVATAFHAPARHLSSIVLEPAFDRTGRIDFVLDFQ